MTTTKNTHKKNLPLYPVLTSKFSWIPTMEVDSIKAEWPSWTQQAHYKETWSWSFLSLKANLCSLNCETVNATFWNHNVAINSLCAALWGFFCDFSSHTSNEIRAFQNYWWFLECQTDHKKKTLQRQSRGPFPLWAECCRAVVPILWWICRHIHSWEVWEL